MLELENKQRIIQEFVPGKQVTLAHLIANPKSPCTRNWASLPTAWMLWAS